MGLLIMAPGPRYPRDLEPREQRSTPLPRSLDLNEETADDSMGLDVALLGLAGRVRLEQLVLAGLFPQFDWAGHTDPPVFP